MIEHDDAKLVANRALACIMPSSSRWMHNIKHSNIIISTYPCN